MTLNRNGLRYNKTDMTRDVLKKATSAVISVTENSSAGKWCNIYSFCAACTVPNNFTLACATFAQSLVVQPFYEHCVKRLDQK